jgi:hypothetical protein
LAIPLLGAAASICRLGPERTPKSAPSQHSRLIDPGVTRTGGHENVARHRGGGDMRPWPKMS